MGTNWCENSDVLPLSVHGDCSLRKMGKYEGYDEFHGEKQIAESLLYNIFGMYINVIHT